MIEVRDAAIDDADALATAHIDGWRVGYRGVVPDEYLDAEQFATSRRDRWRAWTWQSQLPESRMFAVAVQQRIVGFGHAGPEHVDPTLTTATTTTEPHNRGEVYGFYVHPSAWGSGAAAALMSRCEEFLRDEGHATAVLWVLRDNPRALAFYEKAGWRFTGQESTFSPSEPADAPLPRVEFVVRQYEVRL
ncbi:MAG: GNAT family N-acetyltransferase [Ilumatobacteraceae bacterium]